MLNMNPQARLCTAGKRMRKSNFYDVEAEQSEDEDMSTDEDDQHNDYEMDAAEVCPACLTSTMNKLGNGMCLSVAYTMHLHSSFASHVST
jgi:hypothetical protein